MTITWPELIVLMAYGHGVDEPVRGAIRTRDVFEVEDDGDADDDATFEHHPVLGRVCVRENALRVAKRGRLVRLESLDGAVRAVFGERAVWLFGGDAPTAYDRSVSQFGWAGAGLLERLPASRWEGDDFTRLTGPIRAVEFLGRAAWAFELAPPARKRFPMQLTVDAATGLVLRSGNADFCTVEEWTEIEVGAHLPDELFTWDGPTRDPEDREAEHRADLARRQQWLSARGVVPLHLALPFEVLLHEWDDGTGAFHASVQAELSGSLLRRPRSDAPWPDTDNVRWGQEYRWQDERWDWFLGTACELDDAQLATLKAQLARAR